MDTYVYKYGNNLYVNLTNRCSNACRFCIRNNMRGIGGEDLWLEREPEAAEVTTLIGSFKDYDEVVFCGYGESTYRLKELLEVAEHVKRAGKKVRLDTNGLGSLINGFSIVPQLAGRVDSVSVSLNQSGAEKYQDISVSEYGDKAFGHMLEFAKECVLAGIKTFMTVVDVIPPEDIEKCRDIARETGAEFRVREYIA